MVFKKNLMFRVYLFINLFFLLLSSCTYKYNKDVYTDNEEVVKLYLNVSSLEIKKDNLKDFQNKNEISRTINKKILENFEDWILVKFDINGDQNISYLNILKIDTKFLKKKPTKKSFFSVIEAKKDTYNAMLTFDLTFINNEGINKKLKVSSNIDIILSNNSSINKRDRVITSHINKLIQLIDNKITKLLNEDTFNEFTTN